MVAVVTGGSGSGKSEYAENLACSLAKGPLFYIATMMPFDGECEKKIKRHRDLRKEKNFITKECYVNMKSLSFTKEDTVLLECMSNLAANEMYADDGAKEKAYEAITEGIKALSESCGNLIVVTNEVFSDGCDYGEEMDAYIRLLGTVNQYMAGIADEVTEVVYGIPIRHKKKEEAE
ncbi:MAG: bifunctional adenosylcobinamide kinase/adenosylcobinamide-phosphate guanylyltransferase [Lachnospiraceae bacterium]|nr:bifunctional adenosylcobinamide kinase/adenosylcobinamide-phosphate guanylyltransferase [Lachnospiraceae bacterium]